MPYATRSQQPKPHNAVRTSCESRALSQITLVSFTDLPKMQTLTPLKSQITTVFCDSCYEKPIETIISHLNSGRKTGISPAKTRKYETPVFSRQPTAHSCVVPPESTS